MGLFKRVMDALRGRKEDKQQPATLGEDFNKRMAEVRANQPKEKPRAVLSVNGKPVEHYGIKTVDLEKDYEPFPMPWYIGARQYKYRFEKGGIAIEITPAGYVFLLQKWVKKRKEALKYANHSKSRERIKKRIKTAERVLEIVIKHRVTAPEAFKILRGQ